MRVTVDELTEQAALLSTDQRFTLAHRILAAIEPPPTLAIEEAWDREIRDRIAKYEKGASKTIPPGEVFAELDALLHP
jgi:putative addiction module component (TIGR02574 family)